MPGMSGLDLQRELRCRGQKIPIYFHHCSDGPLRAKAFEEGAASFLLKLVVERELLAAIKDALRES